MKFRSIAIIVSILFQFSGRTQNCTFTMSGFNQAGNCAYIGVRNSIDFDTLDSIEFQTTNGVVSFDKHGYTYSPSHIGKSTITLFQKIDRQKIRLASCEIDVKYLPFTLEIGKHTTYFSDTIEVDKVHLLQSHLALRSTNTNLSAFAKILAFELIITRNKEVILQSMYENYDKNVDLQLKEDMKKTQPGDKLTIKGLRYQYGNKYEGNHRSIVIEVK